MPRFLRPLALASLFVIIATLIWAPLTANPWAAPVVLTLLATFVLLALIRGPRWALAAYVVGGLAIALSGCGTLGGLTGQEKLALLKGASDHLQTCTRTYNLNSGFPPSTSVSVICTPQVPVAVTPPAFTVEGVAAIAAEAARKAVEALSAPPT